MLKCSGVTINPYYNIMKKVILGVYCTAHFDVVAEVPSDLEVFKLKKNDLTQLIQNGTIKFPNELHQELITGFDVADEFPFPYDASVYCGSFRLSKFDYLIDNNTITKIK